MKFHPRSAQPSISSAALLFLVTILPATSPAATLNGSFASIPRNSTVNLSTAGPIDWVHWGLFSDASLNRKAGVTPHISDFNTVATGGNTNAFVYAYRFTDNYNGYSWSDGAPVSSATNTTTGVWAYGVPTLGNGFELTVPADTATRTLKVYVGAYAARGAMSATLSDGSAAAYSNTSLANMTGNGPSGTYTINYAAASAGQTLRIRWTVQQGFRPDANVTLQAAALSSDNANNPPTVALASPAENAQFAAPANIAMTALASDFDGTISRVEFYADNQKVGEDDTSPYTANWPGAQPGMHSVKALAYDNGGEVSESAPRDVFVYGTGGNLTADGAAPEASVNLTAEGAADWIHWGLATNSLFNRKANVSPQLGNFEKLGTSPVERYADNYTAYSWNDGAPSSSATSSKTGVFTSGQGEGFALTLPADTSVRTVKIYVGLYGAQGSFQAWLSDFSAPAFIDETLDNVFDSSYAVYTLSYTAASAGKTLKIRYRARQLYDQDFGNVTLQAMTLVGGGGVPNTPPVVALTSPTDSQRFLAPANMTLIADATDNGGVALVEFFQGANKLGDDATAPYSIAWNNVPPGTYSLTARATDNFGLMTTSVPVVVVVGVAPSSVTLLNPRWIGNDFVFSFASQSGASYVAEASSLLDLTGWQLLTNVIGNGSMMDIVDRSQTPGHRFYRLESR